MARLLGVLLTLAAVTLSATGAVALVCGKRSLVVENLESRFDERRHSVAVTDGGNLIEVFVSKGGTWTLVMTTPEGAACILAVGESWESLPEGSEV